mgnify:CR=1 FL=1
MKTKLKIITILGAYAILFGEIVPAFISSRDDVLLTAGILIIIMTIATSYDVAKYLYLLIKGERWKNYYYYVLY